MEELVSKIVKSILDASSQSIEPILGKGKNNQVFKVEANDSTHILRINVFDAEEQLRLYEKEKWCAKKAREVGVLTPMVTHTGMYEEYTYSFQEYIEGNDGREIDPKRIWFALGQIAKSIHKIPAGVISIDYSDKLKTLFADDFFVARGIFSAKLAEQIRQRLEEIVGWEYETMLCHGNLSPTNTIVDEEDKVWLIDWETATGNNVPLADLAEIYTWNTGKENIAEFCRGYELSETYITSMMRDIQTLILLRLVDVIYRKITRSQQENWKDDSYTIQRREQFMAIEDFSKDILFTKNM